MSDPIWLLEEVVIAVHQMLLAEHGGADGIRDKSLLESALAKPRQKFAYEPEASLFDLAAAYSFGIAKNHPFVDGNKRVALTAALVFLEINGIEFQATEPEAAVTFERLAAGLVSEVELAVWFGNNSNS